MTSVDLITAKCIVATLELQGVDRVRGHDRGQRLVADAKANLRQESVDANLFDEAKQAIARAQAGERVVNFDRPRGAHLP